MARQNSTPAADAAVSGKALAGWLGVSPQRISQLADEGVLARDGQGKFPLQDNVRAFCEWQRRDAHRNRREEEQSRLADAKARAVEIRNAREDRQLIDINEAWSVFADAFGMLKAELIGLPARITRDRDTRATIEREVDAMLNRAAERFTDRAQAEGIPDAE